MKKILSTILMVCFMTFSLTGCTEKVEEAKPQLLFYIGITMVKPVIELVDNFEASHNCEIKVIQGGSQDLYDSLKQSNIGDLYMPGSYSYRRDNLDDGLLKDAVLVGYNKATLMVKEGNPLGFTSDLDQLSDKNNRVVICNPESGSIGKETMKILKAHGSYEAVLDHSVYLTTDSRNLTDAIVNGDADICINWFGPTTWEDNKDLVDGLPIDETFAKKKMLILNLTSCSENVELTKAFMAYASSNEGRAVFKKYGFLDQEDLKTIDEVEFE